MVQVTLVDRKSKALTPSRLGCLAHLPTINMTAGCVHGCAYCYIRGYSQYPGNDAVVVYRNTAEQVERELGGKRKRPIAVYFMPVEEVLDQSYRTMRLLLDQGIGVQFVTKGAIPDCFFDLFARRPELVAGQIGLTTLNDQLNAAIEPHAAPAQRRLGDLRRLIQIGVTASLRADPIIYGVTDDDPGLDALFAQGSACGVSDVSVSYLFLRPAIIGSLRRNIKDAQLLQRILAPFAGAACASIRGSDTAGTMLPTDARRAGLERVRGIAQRHGLQLHICGCKNADLTSTRCHLTNLAAAARAQHQSSPQGSLW